MNSMDSKMSVLDSLKRRVFNQEATEQDKVYLLCRAMQLVGGYEILMNMPIPSLVQVLKYIKASDNNEKKAYEKAKHKRR